MEKYITWELNITLITWIGVLIYFWHVPLLPVIVFTVIGFPICGVIAKYILKMKG